MDHWDRDRISQLINQRFLAREYHRDPNLQFVSAVILTNQYAQELLELYRRLHYGEEVTYDESSSIHQNLRLSGLVKEVHGYLKIRNEIYRQVFNLKWIDANSRTKKRRLWNILRHRSQ